MELRNVRAFLAVAEARHFGHAAASLHLTQPALTLRIQVLERELGIQLLQRSAREVRLTAAGEALLPHARSLVEVEDRARREIKDHAAGIAGRLRVAYLTVWNSGLPTSIVVEFRRRFPRVLLETTSGHSAENLERVTAGEVDFAFVAVPTPACKEIEIHAIDRHEIVVVMTPANGLASRESVPIECLRGEPIVSVSTATNSPHIAAARRWLANLIGEEPNIVAEEPIDQLAAAIAQSKVAVTLTTKARAVSMTGEGLVYRHLDPVPLVDYGIAYHRDGHSAVLANMLVVAHELAPGWSGELPPGGVLVWSPQSEN